MEKAFDEISVLEELSHGFQKSAVLQAAIKLDIFTHIKNQGRTISYFVKKLKCSERGISILLDALAGLGLLLKKGNNYYNSPLAKKYLVKESPFYYGHMIEFNSLQWHYWEKLSKSVITGKPARKPDMFQKKAEETFKFVMAMHSIAMSRRNAEFLSKKINLKKYKSLIDIGGGPGTFSIFFCKQNPKLSATILDFPQTIEIAKKVIGKFKLGRRINFVEADFNKDKIPSGYDAAFLSNIIHSEDEKHNKALMKKIFDSLNPGGIIIIKDHILDKSGINPPDAALFSTVMLLFTKGRSYRFIDVEQWLQEAGFKKISLKDYGPPVFSQIITAFKP